MFFNSWAFVTFFLIVFPLYCVLRHRWQNALLLVASYVFYGWWDYRFLILLFASTTWDYFLGNRIVASRSERAKSGWLFLSIVGNLGLLGFFKYYNFFVDSTAVMLRAFGFTPHPATLHIILPAGISFYTFQSMSYVIDLRRGLIAPARSFWHFALALTYFPHLVAGPIQRADTLLPQVEVPRRLSWAVSAHGPVADPLRLLQESGRRRRAGADGRSTYFPTRRRCSSLTLLFGVYCFAFQIYADFSGYTDIARGLSRLMGFELVLNFNQPYLSTTITDFWRRWHISLSSWLRDYLYIPLGGNRHGTWKTYRNLMLTMMLGGLWHGSSWTFVIWGGLHGAYLSVHKWWTFAGPPRRCRLLWQCRPSRSRHGRRSMLCCPSRKRERRPRTVADASGSERQDRR